MNKTTRGLQRVLLAALVLGFVISGYVVTLEWVKAYARDQNATTDSKLRRMATPTDPRV